MPILEAIAARFPGLERRLQTLITPERAFRYLRSIADTHAPSQTVPWTRGPVIERLLREDGVLGRSGVFYSANYGGTGSAALLLGEDPHRKRVWLMSHLDVVSYLVEPETDGEYPLTPYCYHLATGDRPGVALEYRPGQGMVPIMTGTIVAAGDQVRFRPDRPGALRAGHRVVFAAQARWDRATGIVEGSLDNAAGATACLLAATVLAHYPAEVLVSLADEEEAAEGAGNQTLSRGGKRLTQLFGAPDLAVVVDSHVLGDPHRAQPRGFGLGGGASFTEKASGTRGGVVNPPLMELQRRLAAELAAASVLLRENEGGYVPRSECVNAMERTPNVALVGFLNENRHFDSGTPRAHMDDIVHLARALVYYPLLLAAPEWAEYMR